MSRRSTARGCSVIAVRCVSHCYVVLLSHYILIVIMQVCGGLNFQQFIDEQVR
jgi:hypothetical protein